MSEKPHTRSERTRTESEGNHRIDVENAKGDDPRKEDTLFKPTDAHTSAPLNYGVNPDFLYCEGYLRAARILANYACNQPYDRDVLVFPIAFLYRHHVELALKDLVRIAGELSSRKALATGHHFLGDLWTELKRILEDIGEAPSKSEVEGVDAYIGQLEKIDKISETFRYATTKKRQVHLQGVDSIDIRSLAESMERLAGYLGGISARLDILSDHKAEMMSYKGEFEGQS